MHRRERHPKIDGFGSVTLIMEAHSASFDEDIAEIVGVGYGVAIRVCHGFESERVVEYALPFVGQLILIVQDYFLLVGAGVFGIRLMFGSNGLDHFGEKAEGCSGIGGSVVGNVESRGSDTERSKGLFFDLAEDYWCRCVDDIEASLGTSRIQPLSIFAHGYMYSCSTGGDTRGCIVGTRRRSTRRCSVSNGHGGTANNGPGSGAH
mmetsp:Transcript_13512/g.28393  ORF Transcript_13512/g.28393 Transcript_13512/m.28393 type:complete len:206 (-) Transcript_13512:303-920(-)